MRHEACYFEFVRGNGKKMNNTIDLNNFCFIIPVGNGSKRKYKARKNVVINILRYFAYCSYK